MSILGAVATTAFIVWILIEAFEAMVLPRRVLRRLRFNRWFYRLNWPVWLLLARAFRSPKRRETFLSVFGPLSLLALFSSWVVGLIAGFAFLHWSLGSPLQKPTGTNAQLPELLYYSSITFFTIGFGDLVPVNGLGRFLAVLEGGIGFGFLAVIIGYMPVLYQAFLGGRISSAERVSRHPSARSILLLGAAARLGPVTAFGAVLAALLYRRAATLRVGTALPSRLAAAELGVRHATG